MAARTEVRQAARGQWVHRLARKRMDTPTISMILLRHAGKRGHSAVRGWLRSRCRIRKPFGMSAGIGDAPNAVAYLVGGPERVAHVGRPVFVDAQAVAGAALARMTVTRPSGGNEVTTCASLPCSVQVDPWLGNHTLAIDYLTTGGQVLRSVRFTVYGDHP